MKNEDCRHSPNAEDLIDLYFPVLNSGFIALKDYLGNDNAIERAARVSYGKGTRKVSETRDLIRYLLRHVHTTPFEQCELVFHMRLPMDAHRQHVRHRTACLTGDTELWFDEPAVIGTQKRKRSKALIQDLYNKWNKGAKPITTPWENQVSIPLKERIQNRYLRCCNESTGEIVHTKINDIWSNGIKDVFEIELENGYKIKSTKEHQYLTSNGWLTLEQATKLKISKNNKVTWDDNKIEFSCNGIPIYQDKEWLKQQRSLGLNIQQIADNANCSYMTIRKWLKRLDLKFSEKEKGVLRGNAQRGSKRQKYTRKPLVGQALENVRKARSGPASNFWKGGITIERNNIGRWTSENSKKVFQRDNYKCVICKSNKKLNAHHIDPVWHNLNKAKDIYNLTTLCEKCHKRLHTNELDLSFLNDYNNLSNLNKFFENYPYKQTRDINKKKPTTYKLIRTFSKIKNIKYIGREEVFDISVNGPYHNFIANGFVVHNSINEYSTRYSEAIDLCETTNPDEWRLQSKDNKQGSKGFVCDWPDSFKDEHGCVPYEKTGGYSPGEYLSHREQHAQEYIREIYNQRLEFGVAKEQARKDLPLSTATELYWKIDLHNLLHYLRLRLHPHAQKEIREYAVIMAGIVKEIFPLAWEAFEDYRLNSCSFSANEQNLLLEVIRRGCVNKEEQQFNYELFHMNKREIDEFWTKLERREKVDYTIDKTKGKPYDEFKL